MSKIGLIVIFCILVFSSCYYDSEEDLYSLQNCNNDNVSFSNDIQPILASSCLSCHSDLSQQGGITLEGYENVKPYALDGSFAGCVKQVSGYSAMPQNSPKLDNCTISKITSWVDAGSLNN